MNTEFGHTYRAAYHRLFGAVRRADGDLSPEKKRYYTVMRQIGVEPLPRNVSGILVLGAPLCPVFSEGDPALLVGWEFPLVQREWKDVPQDIYTNGSIRAEAAAHLYHLFRNAGVTPPEILTTGGYQDGYRDDFSPGNIGVSRSEAMREVVIRHGVPPEAVHSIGRQGTTEGNFLDLIAHINETAFAPESILYVTSQLQLPRTKRIYEADFTDLAQALPGYYVSAEAVCLASGAHPEVPGVFSRSEVIFRATSESAGLDAKRRGTYVSLRSQMNGR